MESDDIHIESYYKRAVTGDFLTVSSKILPKEEEVHVRVPVSLNSNETPFPRNVWSLC